MNIAILTFTYADNYGALLQAYALKQVIENKGNRVIFLDYIPEKEKKFYETSFQNISSIKEFLKKYISNIERRDSKKAFAEFRRDQFDIIPYVEGVKNSDLLIVGSDQVWNENIVNDLRPYLFSKCSTGKIKISYAASIGKTNISDVAKQTFLQYLKEFNGISVRERSSELLLKSLGFSCQTVVDPVFLLNKEQWSDLAKCPSNSNVPEKYVLAYLLRIDEELISSANRFAKDKNLKLIYVHPMGKQIKSLHGERIKSVGPEEFVWLIENASAVFTNSFHAVSFCCIFGKKFYHVQREELGNRVANLLSTLNTKSTDNGLEIASFGKEFLNIRERSLHYLSHYIGEEE